MGDQVLQTKRKMHLRSLATACSLGLGLLLGASFADAQSENAGGAANAAAAGETPMDVSNIKNADKQKNAEKILQLERDTLKRMTDLLAEARVAKDVVQMNCVNEKLSQVKGLLKVSEQASVSMYESLAGGDQEKVDHNYRKLLLAEDRVKALRNQADRCVGELSVYSGDTEVLVEIDEEISGGAAAGSGPVAAVPGPQAAPPQNPPSASDF